MIKVKVVWLIVLVGLLVTTVQAEQCKSFEIVGTDVLSAKVVFSRNYPTLLEIILEQHRTQEFEKFTKTSINQKIAIIINGEVIAEPTVKETITSGIIRIMTDDEATTIRLAKALTASKQEH